MQPGEPIYHPWLNKGIEKAQKKVEERNFEIRKHLLEYDDVLNEQRKFIYEQRDQILLDDHLADRVFSSALDIVDDLLENYETAGKKQQEAATNELVNQLKQTFGLTVEPEQLQQNRGKERDFIENLLRSDLQEKELLAGSANLNMFIRYQYVQFIDRKWLDHLEELEGLREAVYLRSYGSKNPLTEYKIDGFNIFYDMIASIKTEIASRVFRVKVQKEAPRQGPQVRQMNTQHSAVEAFNGATARQAANSSPMAQQRQGDSVTVVRSTPKVGRNDPCPCGSGKKYKQCCGR